MTTLERAKQLLKPAPEGETPDEDEAQRIVIDALATGDKCAAVVVALSDALPKLRRAHHAFCAWVQWSQRYDREPVRPKCNCGVAGHNNEIDALAAMLDEEG